MGQKKQLRGLLMDPVLWEPSALTWDQADTSHCSFLCL